MSDLLVLTLTYAVVKTGFRLKACAPNCVPAVNVKALDTRSFCLQCLVGSRNSTARHLLKTHKSMCLHKGKCWACSVMSDSCNPTDYRQPGSSVHRILQARTLEWVAMPSSRGSSQPRDQSCISCIFLIGRWILFTTEPPLK